MTDETANGYDGIAELYIAGRGTRPTTGDAIGAREVRAWAESQPTGATVLDLGYDYFAEKA